MSKQSRDRFFTSDSNHTTAINPVTGEPGGAAASNQKREEAARLLAEADRFDERKGGDLMAALRTSINRARAARLLREADELVGKDGA